MAPTISSTVISANQVALEPDCKCDPTFIAWSDVTGASGASLAGDHNLVGTATLALPADFTQAGHRFHSKPGHRFTHAGPVEICGRETW